MYIIKKVKNPVKDLKISKANFKMIKSANMLSAKYEGFTAFLQMDFFTEFWTLQIFAPDTSTHEHGFGTMLEAAQYWADFCGGAEINDIWL